MPSRAMLLAALAVCVVGQGAAQLPRRPYFGARLGASTDSGGGARVTTVPDGTPAARAGLLPEDILTQIGAMAVRDVRQALVQIRALQVGAPVALKVRRAAKVLTLSLVPNEWPREDPPDFDVLYTMAAAPDGRRRVILTHPRSAGRHPAMMLIGDFGCYSIDAPWGQDAYRELMYHLTRRGYVTARVEKSGIGDSEGPACPTADLENEIVGYLATLGTLRADTSVDTTRIFLFGHGSGGLSAPVVFWRDPGLPPIRGIAVFSPVGVAWYEHELATLRRELALAGVAPDTIELVVTTERQCGSRLLFAGESAAAIAAAEPVCQPYVTYPVADRYLQQLAALSVDSLWHGVRVPVLVLHAGSDYLASADEDRRLQATINAAHPGQATYAEVAGVDHAFSAESSQQTSFADSKSGRRSYSTAIEPVLDAWLDGLR